jgi:5-methylcytosine-specific restriction endonuclease McrA
MILKYCLLFCNIFKKKEDNNNDDMNNNEITKDDCLKWLENKLINPKTNRKIKEDCITYNKFKKKSIEYGIISINDNNNDKNEITREDCMKWLQNKLINPKTNRKIKEDCITYNKFKKKSIEYGIMNTNDSICINDYPYKKKNISSALKKNVWSKYIGLDKGIAKCYCCNTIDIYQISFHCGHVIPEVKGGETNVSNLRPICQNCNSSMGATNMNLFMEQFS